MEKDKRQEVIDNLKGISFTSPSLYGAFKEDVRKQVIKALKDKRKIKVAVSNGVITQNLIYECGEDDEDNFIESLGHDLNEQGFFIDEVFY